MMCCINFPLLSLSRSLFVSFNLLFTNFILYYFTHSIPFRGRRLDVVNGADECYRRWWFARHLCASDQSRSDREDPRLVLRL